MSYSLCYWILMLLWVIFGIVPLWPTDRNFRPLGNYLILFFLLLVIGFKVFGWPLHE